MDIDKLRDYMARRQAALRDLNPEHRLRFAIETLLGNISSLKRDSPIEVFSSYILEELDHTTPEGRHVLWRKEPLCVLEPGTGKVLMESWTRSAQFDSGVRWRDLLGALYVEIVRPRRPVSLYERTFPAVPTPWVYRRV